MHERLDQADLLAVALGQCPDPGIEVEVEPVGQIGDPGTGQAAAQVGQEGQAFANGLPCRR
ncbi:MAG TPA: hypothetical protein VGL46_21860 [Pseudonocardiaceae bacterium]